MEGELHEDDPVVVRPISLIPDADNEGNQKDIVIVVAINDPVYSASMDIHDIPKDVWEEILKFETNYFHWKKSGVLLSGDEVVDYLIHFIDFSEETGEGENDEKEPVDNK